MPTSPHADLRLTIPMERRRAPRVPIGGGAMAIFSDGGVAGTLTRVALLDASHTGLGVLSPAPVRPGSSFSLVPDSAAAPRQIGMVVRCEREEGGYRLGLRGRVAKAVA